MIFDLLMVAAVTVYIVDLSGFTESWRNALARWLHIKALRDLPPFDCGKCATWWACLIFAWCKYGLTLEAIAVSALLSFLSVTIGNLLHFIRDWMDWAINKFLP